MDGAKSVTFDIVSSKTAFTVTIPSYGHHLALMALPAAIVGNLLGLTDGEISRGLSKYSPVGGRANVIDTGYITVINDCYNANPTSVKAALTSLGSLNGRRVAILGGMNELGHQSNELHRETGIYAAESGLELLISCGEKAKFINDGYLSAGGISARHFDVKSELIAALSGLIEKGDNVLVKASHSMGFDEIVDLLQS